MGLLVAVQVEAKATIRRVPADYSTIQQAINASVNDDTVAVAPGTYVENINFLGKAIIVTSEAGPQVTIIDGNRAGPVVTLVSGEGRASVLSGFTLRNGQGPGFIPEGGGIRINNSSPTITRNVITQNAACEGIGILVDSGSPLIQSNTITDNAIQLCTGGSGGGGILILRNSTPEIYDNIISDNFLDSRGGGIASVVGAPVIKRNLIDHNGANSGCGIALLGGSAIIEDNIISNNLVFASSGGSGGGGISVLSGANADILDNKIIDNFMPTSNGGGVSVSFGGQTTIRGNLIRGNTSFLEGGGVYLNVGSTLVVQNIIVKNVAFSNGGGIWGLAGVSLVNNTIAENQSPTVSGVYGSGSFMTSLYNNIVVGTPGIPALFCDSTFESNPAIFMNNDIYTPNGIAIAGQCSTIVGTSGNISADPLFVSSSTSDYHLRPGSPSIDAPLVTIPLRIFHLQI